MTEELAEELHAEERAAALSDLSKQLKAASDDRVRQRTYNIVIFIAIVVGAFLIVGNRQLINRVNNATGTDALQAQLQIIEDLKCDNRQSLGEALAALGINPPPLRKGCPSYSVVVAPTSDNGQNSSETVTATERTSAKRSAGTTYVVLAQPAESSPQPEPAEPPTTAPENPPEPQTPPTTEKCALGVVLLGCLVQS